MIGRFKSGVLILLVMLSLMQSYFLSYSSPSFDPLASEKYVQTDRIGEERSVEDVLFPDQVVLHLGNQQHSVLYPRTAAYHLVVGNVNQRSIEGIRRTTLGTLSLNWDEIRMKQPSIELCFHGGVPLSILSRVMQLKGDLPADAEPITNIWFLPGGTGVSGMGGERRDEMRMIMVSNGSNVAYEAQKVDLYLKDLERYTTMEGLIPYVAGDGDYYLPATGANLMFPLFRGQYEVLTLEQLKRLFFVDPALIRNLSERDGSDIYTDGKKGLKVRRNDSWLSYSDPIVPPDAKVSPREQLLSVVQFINQHGGWNGSYQLSSWSKKVGAASDHVVEVGFRQYAGSLPVIGGVGERFGSMRAVSQKGALTNFERSFKVMQLQMDGGESQVLPDETAVRAWLQQYKSKELVVRVFPAYRAVMEDSRINLMPMWTVQLLDGSYVFME